MKNFYNTYLTLDLKESLGVDLEINKLILLLAAALCVACVIIERKQGTESLILRKLIRSEAFGESNARSLRELGLDAKSYAARILSTPSGAIRTVVFLIGETKQTYEEYIAADKERRKLSRKQRKAPRDGESSAGALSDARFYIPEDRRERAQHLFERNVSSPARTALYCLLIIAFAVALVLLMPAILAIIGKE